VSPTESRKSAERLAEARRQERLAYIGTLASGLAHEIRNPLNAIKLNVELIESELAAAERCNPAALKKRLARIHGETDQLAAILNEFLAFARPPKMELLVTDLNQYLEDLLEFYEPECRKAGIALKRDFARELYPVRIDPAQFKNVVLNLLINAREAVGEQGEITVSTRELEHEVQIRVADNGDGVKSGDEERVFEVFFSTKERGTGLGLAIARRIVEEHGGRLSLENRPGRGATFVIRLPKGIFLEFEQEKASGATDEHR
jgi:two-component system NtrC family sensor kinase